VATPAPAPAAAPKYAIGAEGPGGGIGFSNSGGKYKEVLPKAYSQEEYKAMTEQDAVGFLVVSPVNGYSDWEFGNKIGDLRAVYANLQKTGKVNFGDVWVRADWLRVSQAGKPYNPMDERFPGYGVYLTAGGSAHYYRALRLSDGKEGVVTDVSVGYGCYLVDENDEPDTTNIISEYYLFIRQF
jgi:hypothetical protein